LQAVLRHRRGQTADMAMFRVDALGRPLLFPL